MYGNLLTKLKLNLSNNVTVLTELSQGQVVIWRREMWLVNVKAFSAQA